jgi:hypothetical protein
MEEDEKRSHCVSSRLNAGELSTLDSRRRKIPRGEYLRIAALDRLPVFIPEVNASVQSELGKIGGNLNQYQKAVNQGRAQAYPPGTIEELQAAIGLIREILIGGAS